MGNERQTLIRTLHDIGLAAWFGGSLFGIAGLNGAAAEGNDLHTARRVASIGWAKWTPVATAAIGTHLVGATGLLAANRDRVATQPGPARNTTVKVALTGIALGVTAYTRVLGKKIEQAEVHRAKEVSSTTTSPVVSGGDSLSGAGAADKAVGEKAGAVAERMPLDVGEAERQLRYAQYAVPILTGVLLALGAQHGEQQRPGQQLWELARLTGK